MKKDDEITAKIIELISTGVTYRQAALAAGIGKSTLARWKSEDQEFRAALKKAEAQAHARAVKCISDSWQKNWQAAAWWLERRYPQRYAKPSADCRQESGPQGQDKKNQPAKKPNSAEVTDFQYVIGEMMQRGFPPYLIEMVDAFLHHPLFETFHDGLDAKILMKLAEEHQHKFPLPADSDYLGDNGQPLAIEKAIE